MFNKEVRPNRNALFQAPYFEMTVYGLIWSSSIRFLTKDGSPQGPRLLRDNTPNKLVMGRNSITQIYFNEGEKVLLEFMLEFTGIFQFSQTRLIFEINIAKEIEKLIARNLNET